MLVTLSTALDPRPRDTLAKTQARDGLDLLAGLYRDQVTGLVSPQRLRTLRDWARRRLRPDDPELGAILDEIETRLLVELAKAGERDPEADPFAD